MLFLGFPTDAPFRDTWRATQVLQQSLEERGRDGNALQQREQRMGEAMDALTARRSAAQEAFGEAI